LNICGKLIIDGNYHIGRGSRIDIGKEAVMVIKGEGFINANTQIVIMHSLVIGKDCVISWNCQFLDENFHKLYYDAMKKKSAKGIEIGDHVWIGCNAKIYGGTIIPNGSVIAADSVVKNIFTVENCLIAGNPAQIVKRNISWEH
jgi:acetyltransferase-like isoleucine patch superfamily enzyme